MKIKRNERNGKKVEKISAQHFTNIVLASKTGNAPYDFEASEGIIEVKSCQLRTLNDKTLTRDGRFAIVPRSHRKLQQFASTKLKPALYHFILYSKKPDQPLYDIVIPWREVDLLLKGHKPSCRYDGVEMVLLDYPDLMGVNMNFLFEGVQDFFSFNSLY